MICICECIYLSSSPSLSSVSESFPVWWSFTRSTSSLHSSKLSLIFTLWRYFTVSAGNTASHGRPHKTGRHTLPDLSFWSTQTNGKKLLGIGLSWAIIWLDQNKVLKSEESVIMLTNTVWMYMWFVVSSKVPVNTCTPGKYLYMYSETSNFF